MIDDVRDLVSRRQFLAGLGGLTALAVVGRVGRRWTTSAPAALDVTRPALGTYLRVVVEHSDPAAAERAVQAAFDAVALADRQMSIHRADSQIARVNAAAGGAAVPVDEAVRRVLGLACAMARRTGGIYTPAVLPLMRAYGFYASGSAPCRWPSDRVLARVHDLTDWRQVVIDDAAGTVGLRSRGAAIDLGSIGKGWAVDRAVDAARAHGVHAALIDAGGNIGVIGAPRRDAHGWSVGVLDPRTQAVGRTLVLRDAAIATSANTENAHEVDGVRVGHILDAVRGRPATRHLGATIHARTATAADVSSTAAFLTGADDARAWPDVFAAYVV